MTKYDLICIKKYCDDLKKEVDGLKMQTRIIMALLVLIIGMVIHAADQIIGAIWN